MPAHPPEAHQATCSNQQEKQGTAPEAEQNIENLLIEVWHADLSEELVCEEARTCFTWSLFLGKPKPCDSGLCTLQISDDYFLFFTGFGGFDHNC